MSQRLSRSDFSRRPRLLYVVTHPMTARHLLAGQLAWMSEHGFEVAVACAAGPDLDVVAGWENVEVIPFPIRREMAPAADLRALMELRRIMRGWRPHVVNAGTPKAGLLGMIAAGVVGVPVRIYMLRGLRLETTSGFSRMLLRATERLAMAFAHEVVAVSHSLREVLVEMGLARPEKVKVLGAGASNGVHIERFASPNLQAVDALRRRLRLDGASPIVGFVGRLTRDKGIGDLVDAMELLRVAVPDARLLLVGDFEDGDEIPEATVRRIQTAPWIVQAGFLTDTAPAYALMEVLAFPSYREGFPNAPLEAAAAGLPVAGFRATGTIDAVMHGETGTLVEAGDAAGLADALRRYLEDQTLREGHGRAGQARARAHFQPEQVWEALLAEYNHLLSRAPTAPPEAFE